MAISASKSKNLYCSNSSSHPYTIYVKFTESSTSVANNTSKISISGYMIGDDIGWDSNYNSYLKLYWHDNNTNTDKLVATSSGFKSLSMNTKKKISGSITVTHKADGSLSGYAKISYVAGSTSGGWAPSSNSVSTANTALTKIARASSISSLSGTYIGSSVSVSISRQISTATHKVEYSFAGSGYTTVDTDATNSCVFTPPLSLCRNIPNSTSGTLTIRITTYYGGSQIGSSVTKSITLYVPSSVVPSIGGVSLSRVDNGVPSSWGVYVKGFSKCTAAITSASGSYGSTIKSYYISGGGLSTSSSSGTTGVLNSAGTITFTFTVTDSRGRTASKTLSISVIDYYSPSISVSAKRCTSDGTENGSGTYLKVTANYSIASISGKNSVSSRSVSCNGVSNTSFSSGVAFVLAANCSQGSSYVLTASVTDALGRSASVTYDISTAERIMNVKANKKGVAFGKFAEDDYVVDFGWGIRVEGNSLVARATPPNLPSGVTWYSSWVNDYNPESYTGDKYWTLVSSPNDFYTGVQLNGASTVSWVKLLKDGGSYGTLHLSNWYRSTGATGWYNETYGGGIYMTDSSYVRVYNNKNFKVDGLIWVAGQGSVIGSMRFSTSWFSIYSNSADAAAATNRLGWIGHNGTADFSIYNEAGGAIALTTSGKGICFIRHDDGSYVFRAAISNYGPRLGSPSYRWYSVYLSTNPSVSSDIRLKTNIQKYDERFERLFFDLKPVRYELKKRMGQSHGGLIAQWVKEAMDNNDISDEEFGAYEYDSENDEYGIVYSELISLNTHMVQKAYKKIDEQQKEIDDLKAQVQELKELVLAMSKKGE